LRAPSITLQARRGLASADTGDVNDMQRSAGCRGVGDDFLQRRDRAVRVDGSPHVNEHGQLAISGQLKQVQDLFAARGGNVSDAESNTNGVVKALPDGVDYGELSSSVPTRCAAGSRGRKSPVSCITRMRAGTCPEPAPKLISAFPLRSA